MRPNVKGFTLVEIVIIVLVIGILMAIAIPGMLHARSSSQAKTCVENLSQMEEAKEQFAMAARLSNGAEVSFDELVPAYMNAFPTCPGGGVYTLGAIGENPTCSLGGTHSLVGSGMGDPVGTNVKIIEN